MCLHRATKMRLFHELKSIFAYTEYDLFQDKMIRKCCLHDSGMSESGPNQVDIGTYYHQYINFTSSQLYT